MSKLLFIFEEDMPSVSITRAMFKGLEHHPEIVSDFLYMTDVRPKDIDMSDIIIFIRPSNIYAWKIAACAAKAGHVVVTLCDDDLLNLPNDLPVIPWRKAGLLKVLKYSDAIWSSSSYVLNKYKHLIKGTSSIRLDTIVYSNELPSLCIKHSNFPIKIVYAAAKSHAQMFEAFISPIVPKLCDKYGSNISFTFVGVHPNIPGVNCEYISSMPLLEYRQYMRQQRFDIGVAPLYESDFTKCKYFNKFIEYTTQGIVGVFSNVEPYKSVIIDGENGFLANNTPEEWLKTLNYVIEEKTLRETCLKNAVDYLKEYHNESTIIERLKNAFPEAFSDSLREYKRCRSFFLQKIIYTLSRPFDWIWLSLFYLRRTGLVDVIDRAKKRLLRDNSYSRRKE